MLPVPPVVLAKKQSPLPYISAGWIVNADEPLDVVIPVSWVKVGAAALTSNWALGITAMSTRLKLVPNMFEVMYTALVSNPKHV